MQVPFRFFALAGICLISNHTGKAPVSSSTQPVADAGSPSTVSSFPVRFSLPRQARHLRGILRFARRRHSLALALLVGSASTLGAVTVAAAAVDSFYAHWPAPLAPPKPVTAAAALAPITAPKPRHRLLSNVFHTNPLRGVASWYGLVLHGHKTASGETFQEKELTAAHRTLPFGTLVKVTDMGSRRSVVVRINDRGALAPNRVIDLSSAAATELGILRAGVARVKLEVLGRRPLSQSETQPPEMN